MDLVIQSVGIKKPLPIHVLENYLIQTARDKTQVTIAKKHQPQCEYATMDHIRNLIFTESIIITWLEGPSWMSGFCFLLALLNSYLNVQMQTSTLSC